MGKIASSKVHSFFFFLLHQTKMRKDRKQNIMICGRWEVAKSYLITLMGKNNPKCNIVSGWKIVIILLLRRLHFSYFSKDFCYCTLENRIFSTKEFDFPFEKSQVISTLTLIPFSIEIHWTRENVWGEIKKSVCGSLRVLFCYDYLSKESSNHQEEERRTKNTLKATFSISRLDFL